MTFEEIYYVSQIVAVIVIVATLFAILYQGHQTNKIARADLTLTMWMQTGAMHYALYDNPEKADFMHRAMYEAAPLKDGEKDRFYTALGMAIGTHEAAFNLRKRGLVEAAAYERNAGSTRLYLQSPRGRKWWSRARNTGMDPRFRDIVDAIAKDIEDGAARTPSAGEKSN
ncbi:MAG: hypothetical protein ABL957_09705 [Parvularculaceae bacterium]